MPTQPEAWSNVAADYEEHFIDPYRDDVRNPLPPVLRQLAAGGAKVVADLGCGTGPLLPTLAQSFPTVYAVDFAPGMLERARQRCAGERGITYLQMPMTDLASLPEPLDVATSVNSLVMPDVADQDKALRAIHAALRPGGSFLGILPAMDAEHYFTMLLVDRALARGLPIEAARKNAADLADHGLFDFAFGQFRFKGLHQHFWQPFEIRHRFKKAGFRRLRLARVLLSWEQFACGDELKRFTPPWDWFVRAEKPA